MRIVGGAFKGRRISAPTGLVSRPTTDRTREAIFNILAHDADFELHNARIIDLFAGSGALGLEALSRGGANALFVDTDNAARGAIRENIEALGLFGCARIQRRSALKLGPRPAGVGGRFTLAFLDPPYHKEFCPPALHSLVQGDWLAPGAKIVVEQAKDEPEIDSDSFALDARRNYGDTAVSFLTFRPTPSTSN